MRSLSNHLIMLLLSVDVCMSSAVLRILDLKGLLSPCNLLCVSKFGASPFARMELILLAK